MKWLIVILILTIVLIAGCTQIVTPICLNNFPSSYDIKDVEMTIERTACYGTCPDYSLQIFGNGTIVYNGNGYVAVKGIKTSQISQDKVTELINEFKAADYFCLQDNYREPVTDMPTTITSIIIGGKTKRISDYVSGPDKLKSLENKIDEISGDKVWIKTSDITCVDAGGTVKIQLCCNSADDFPSTCSIGACGCAPDQSHEVKICDCGEGKCWSIFEYKCQPLINSVARGFGQLNVLSPWSLSSTTGTLSLNIENMVGGAVKVKNIHIKTDTNDCDADVKPDIFLGSNETRDVSTIACNNWTAQTRGSTYSAAITIYYNYSGGEFSSTGTLTGVYY